MRTERATARTIGLLALALISALSIAGCDASDKIVFKDRAPFNPPKDATSGFLGYYKPSTKQTTCGNCHADFQKKWVTTKHAGAWTALNSSPGKQESCFSCHSVTGKGNKAVGTLVAHDVVKDSTYYDVQCESCHGAGQAHVEGVASGSLTRPLARISMGGTGNCGDCHSGVHTPFAEEWAASGHNKLYTSAASNISSGCAGCHDGRKALERWGVTDNYAERDSATAYQRTTCAVCHAPHGSSNPSQLRFSVSSTDPAQNLCMQCHMRRTEPSTTASSPHAPQGAVLLGFAGWRPPGFVYDTARIYGSHATTANPKLCAGCHVTKFTVNDAATGAFVFQSTGHLMRPLPCLDATGKPIADKTCAYSTVARSWKSCAVAGCHATEAVASAAFATVRSRMKFYTDQLWTDVNLSGSITAAPTDGGLLATLKSTRPLEWSSTDPIVTPAEGAEFNTRLCGEFNQSTADNSKGIHNPFLCEALLVATITYIKSYYGLPVAAATMAEMSGPIGGTFNASMHVSRTPPGK